MEIKKLIDLIKANTKKISRNKKLISLNDKIDTSQIIFNHLSENIY